MPLKEDLRFYVKKRFPKSGLNTIRRINDISHGFWPLPLSTLVMAIKSRKLETYQQKMIYKIAFDRNPLICTFADKYLVRDYISKKIGEDYLTNILGVYSNADEIIFANLPRNFAMKASHGSGGVVLVSENADRNEKLPVNLQGVNWERYLVHPDSLDLQILRKLAKHWLTLNFWNSYGHYPEWAYKNISPRIIVEELLNQDGHIPQDFRFFIFNGSCEFVEVDSRWDNIATKTLFNRNWEFINASRNFPGRKPFATANPLPNMPQNFEKMRELAESLAEEVDHLRVDFYCISGKIVVGELTNYHTSGLQKFSPESFNKLFGKSWSPQKHYPRKFVVEK